MASIAVDRRVVLSGLGAGALGATLVSGAARAPAAAQTWMRIEAAGAAEAKLEAARRLGVDAVTVDGSRLSSGVFASFLEGFVPTARQAGLDVHADLGDLGPRTPRPRDATSDRDRPPFARTPHHRLFDPVAEALRDHLKMLLAIPDLAGLQLASFSNGLGEVDGLIAGHVIAPARLRGKVVTARIASGPVPSAWALDAVFHPVTQSRGGYDLLRQVRPASSSAHG